jgi:hypothetical protein
MKSDTVIEIVIVVAIAVFVIGFVVWQKAKPKSDKPSQVLFLAPAVLCSIGFVWMIARAYFTFRRTGINVLSPVDPLCIALLAAINWFGFYLSRRAERRERSVTAHDKNA